MRALREMLRKEAQKNMARVITLLQYVGEETVNRIRTSDISNWNDQTGNLRSSIGYIITLDGQPIQESSFDKVEGPKNAESNEDGSVVGITYARSLSSLYSKGIALIIVAGMEYASYVEKRDNKTVLAQAELEAPRLVQTLFTQLQTRTGKK